MSICILVADDHPLFRSAISLLLTRLNRNIQVTEVEDFSSLLALLLQQKILPSLILLDLKLPDTQGIEGLLNLKKLYPALPVVIVSAYDDQKVIKKAMQYGASGFISKSIDMAEMAQAITEVLDGEIWFPQLENDQPETSFTQLTSAQLKVLNLLKEGKANKEIACITHVTEATIKAHLTAIFRKLNVSNRTQAVVAAKELDLPNFDL